MKESEVSGERKRGAEDWKMVRTRRLETGVQKFKRTWRRKRGMYQRECRRGWTGTLGLFHPEEGA